MTIFDVDVELRWVDLDAQSHVNNAIVIDYLQQARIKVLLNSPNGPLLRTGIVVVSHSIEYAAPISYDTQPLQVRLRIGDLGAARLSYGYELFQRGRLVARARSQACAYDFTAGRPRRFTPGEREGFAGGVEPLDEWTPLGPFTLGADAHVHPIEVRWSDLDAYGHVNNAQFFTFTGEARVALNHALDPTILPTEMASATTGSLLIARQDLRYLEQLEHRLEPYAVRTGIARVGRTSVTFAHELVDPGSGRVYVRAAAVLVHADATGRPSPVPQGVREAAERWRAD